MKTTRLLLFLSITVLFSCKKELQPQDSSSEPKDSAAVAATPQAQTPEMAQTQTMPMPEQSQQGAATVTQAPAQVPKGMNPAHGQPGHRCDIAVGAPLNSPVKTAAAQKNSAESSVTINPSQAVTAAKTAPGMNPPHGQEGHRCDIPVGSPLSAPKSVPAATPSTTTSTVPDVLATPATESK